MNVVVIKKTIQLLGGDHVRLVMIFSAWKPHPSSLRGGPERRILGSAGRKLTRQ